MTTEYLDEEFDDPVTEATTALTYAIAEALDRLFPSPEGDAALESLLWHVDTRRTELEKELSPPASEALRKIHRIWVEMVGQLRRS